MRRDGILKSDTGNQRRWIASASSFTSSVISYQKPWVVMWWSLSFPGFGHILTNNYIWGFILVSFEIIVNTLGSINMAIFYSFLGDIEKAKEVLNIKWTFMYICVYVFTIADSYRRCVDINKEYRLAYLQQRKIAQFHFSPLEINLFERRQPYTTLFWSMIMPGLGMFQSHRTILFLFMLLCWSVVIIFSNIYEAFFYSMMGDIDMAISVLNPQWALFVPSMYVFSMYSSYCMSIENNKIFEIEKSRFLKDNYQEGDLNKIYD